MNILHEKLKTINTLINVEKIKTMVLSRENETHKVVLNLSMELNGSITVPK